MATQTATAADTFTGFPPQMFSFLEGLEKDNSKAYWQANQAIYLEVVKQTLENLMAVLEPDFGPLRTFRPHRDTRFSGDKTPYKTWVGVTTSDRAVGGVGAFFRLEPSGIRLAAGAMAFAPDQVKSFRHAMDNVAAAQEFTAVCRKLQKQGLPVGPGRQPLLQRPPSGFAPDHPQAEQLRWKGAVVIKEYDRAGWMSKPPAIEMIRDVWTKGAPLIEWIETHVGASATPARRPR